MIRFTTMAATAALLVGMAPLAACASNNEASAQSAAQQAQTAPPAQAQAQAQAPATTGYTDAQIEAFVAARDQINQMSPGSTPEQQAANQQRIAQILQEAGITPDLYNQILAASQTDQTLNNRIAVAAVGDSFTDAQLQAFIAATTEIQPLNTALSTGTPEEREQAAEQVRNILQRNNLTIETYNGIAAQIRSNPELQARLNALSNSAAAPSAE